MGVITGCSLGKYASHFPGSSLSFTTVVSVLLSFDSTPSSFSSVWSPVLEGIPGWIRFKSSRWVACQTMSWPSLAFGLGSFSLYGRTGLQHSLVNTCWLFGCPPVLTSTRDLFASLLSPAQMLTLFLLVVCPHWLGIWSLWTINTSFPSFVWMLSLGFWVGYLVTLCFYVGIWENPKLCFHYYHHFTIIHPKWSFKNVNQIMPVLWKTFRQHPIASGVKCERLTLSTQQIRIFMPPPLPVLRPH